MLKKNNFISIQDLYFFGLNNKYIQQTLNFCGLNYRFYKFYIKNSQILKLQKKLNNNLTGKLLKKRLYQLKNFSKQLKNIN